MSAVVFLSLSFLSSGLAALPKGWTTCSQSAPDFQPCIQKAVTDAILFLMPGNKALGTMPLDPMIIKEMAIPKHPGPVSVDITSTDIHITGLKDLRIHKIELDWKTAFVDAHIPSLNSYASYKVDGQVMLLPVRGEGKSNTTFLDMDVGVKLHMGSIEKNGVKYITVDNFIVDLKPKQILMHFGNIFNGDKVLGDTVNSFLNENWKEIYEEFQPAMQKGMSVAFSAIANQVLSKIPADQIKLP